MLLKEYRKSLKDLKSLKDMAPEYEQKIYAGMMTDLQYAIDWMRTGKRPGDRNSIYNKILAGGHVTSLLWFADPAASKAFEKVENEN